MVKYPPGMGSAPVESRLRELLLPPPMEGLKMGVLGTTVALTVAAREKKSRMGRGGCGVEGVAGPLEASRPSQPYLSPKVSSYCYPTPPLLSQRQQARAAKQTLWSHCVTDLAGAPAVSPPKVAW